MAGPYTKPTVSGSTGAWGTILNNFIDAITTDLTAAETVGNAALPKAGGTMTGEIVTKTQVWTHTALGSVSGATALDLDVANSFSATITGATTISLSNVPSNAVYVSLELTNGGSATITWPSGVLWPGGSEPSWTESGVDVATFFTRNGGTTWYGALAIANAS